MSLLQARGLALRFAQEQPLFHAVDFDINPGDRIALVGPNGAGKTSLLRILNGDQPPDSGVITRRRGLSLASFHYAEGKISDWSEDVEPLLRGLGFDTALFYTPLAHLSAGQRSRAYLARALAQPADLLLLDEPTNHLDTKARAWLEHYLLRHQRTCLFVSHDEDFLNAVATRVFELRRGQFREFTGNYESFQVQSATIQQRHWSAYETEQRQFAALEKASRERDTLSTKVAHTPPGGAISRAFYGHKAAKIARTARLLRERLPREARHAKPWEEQPIPKLDFQNYTSPSDPPIDLQNLTLAYDNTAIVHNLTLTIRRGERWAIRGSNGSGKTTLFRAIRNELPPANGAVKIGHNVKLGYFAQEAETLDPNETPLQACLRECPDLTWIRTILACLKLPRDYAEVPVRQLSLGERAKTALAQVLVSGANVLLLDEPTNHLEIEARHALTETLQQWNGTILFVSHDEAFLEAIATHSVLFPLQQANLA
jgi:ATPase subunit of ABC transporter with duplicated ATPase domains